MLVSTITKFEISLEYEYMIKYLEINDKNLKEIYFKSNYDFDGLLNLKYI